MARKLGSAHSQKIEESAKIKELEIIRKRIEELQNEFYGVREYVTAELA